MSLPGAAELFRPTRPAGGAEDSGSNGHPRGGSGRTRHDEKITVYVSAEELLALEQARLFLRAEYGVAVDRGRIVREAISTLLTELAVAGEDSELIRRLSSRPA